MANPTPFSRFKSRVIRRMTACHLAGPAVEDAVRICEQAALRGWRTTIGYWSCPEDVPGTNSRRYREVLEVIVKKPLNAYISIKVPGLDYDPGIVEELAAYARELDVRIHFDAMGPETAVPTFSLLERVLRTHQNLGCTLPARWQRSIDDVNRVREYGVPVRVVKGQWRDPDAPRLDARQSFMKVVQALERHTSSVAVATHDRPLAVRALGGLVRAGVCCEMEQLSSLPLNCSVVAQSMHVPLRLYVPFGYPGLPYDVWQMRARPQMLAWVIRDAFAGRHRNLQATG